MKVTAIQRDRAAGDALGAPFEFGPPHPQSVSVEMTGGGGWDSGEWTDDTAMAVAICEAAADGLDLRSTEAQDRIVARWYESMEILGRGRSLARLRAARSTPAANPAA